jgi:muramidase (phage lysozyme)
VKLTDLENAAKIPNVIAFLDGVVREGESSHDASAWTVLYGGTHFKGFDDHPRIRFPITYQGRPNYTTAAGAFQIVETTWNEFTREFGPMDFRPEHQTLCAVWRLVYRKALDAVIAGRLDEAIRRCTNEWTSLALPKIQKKAAQIFQEYGGTLAEKAEESPVNPAILIPIIQTLGPKLVELIPALGSLFGSGSQVQQRNVAGLQMVAQAITEVAQSDNIVSAVQKMEDDPELVREVRDKVNDLLPYILGESGGGGIEGARKFSVSPDHPNFWKQGAFWISLVLILMPFMLLADVFYAHPDSYDSNLRTQIVTAVLLTIGMVGGFWLGSSFGSQKKDAVKP